VPTVFYFTPESLPELNPATVASFVDTEEHFLKSLSISREKNVVLQCMCFLWGIGFLNTPSRTRPTKKVMESALANWVG
jgi:hypothetical protein